AKDSALAARILLAEDRRDSTSTAFAEGTNSADPRIHFLARRAAARTRDSAFAARDSLPALPSPPTYPDPAWRLRYRALVAKRGDCVAIRAAFADSAWPVRLRAADVVGVQCGSDTTVTAILRLWARAPVPNGSRARGRAGWQAAAHALVSLARLAPDTA